MPLAIAGSPKWFHVTCKLIFLRFARLNYQLVLLFQQILASEETHSASVLIHGTFFGLFIKTALLLLNYCLYLAFLLIYC